MDRRCTDRSVRGIGVPRERLESRLLLMLLGRSLGAVSVLSADRLMPALMHLEQACCAALVNPNMKHIVT